MKKFLYLPVLFFFQTLSAQNVGIGTNTPSEKLDVNGNINIRSGGTIKTSGISGSPNQVLSTNASGNLAWTNMTSTTNSVGFGAWGDCSVNNISEYHPVAEADGAMYDRFGQSTSISGDYAIVGSVSHVGANYAQGSVSFYHYNGNNWEFMQKITDATGLTDDRFGNSVSISGNYAIVGAYHDDFVESTDLDDNQGSASIYQFNGTSWVLMKKITDSDGGIGDCFGYSVSISGNNVIVGAYQDEVQGNPYQGSASIYQYDGKNWVLMEKITDLNGNASDEFGNSVSISGNFAIVGAFVDDAAGSEQGSVSIYKYTGYKWVVMQKIFDATGAPLDQFGMSVSISGNYVIVGSLYDDVAANDNKGSASIYQFNGSSWVLMKKIINTSGISNDCFGFSVAISGDYAIVGTNNYYPGSIGSATIYVRVGNIWQKLQYFTDPAGIVGDQFGSSVALDQANKRFVIGAGNVELMGKVVFGKIN